MDAVPGPSRRAEPSSQSASCDPKTPVKKTRFAGVHGAGTPGSVLATPASCKSACSNLSSLADTPLSAKMAKMADRCIALLDEYFAEQHPRPLSPVTHAEAGEDLDDLSDDSSATLVSADDHSAKTFHRYPDLPTEVQDMILEEAVTAHPSRHLAMGPDGAKSPAIVIAAVSKKTREQVIRIMKSFDKCSVSLAELEGCGTE